jgi:hypothetical protein
VTDLRDELDGYAAEFEALRIADGERLQRYADYVAETEEARIIDLNADIGDLDYGRKSSRGNTKRRSRIAVPLGQATTVKHAYRISGRLPDAVVDRRAETPEERYRSDTMEKMWWGITRESQGDEQFASAAWDASKLGAACFECVLEHRDDDAALPRDRPGGRPRRPRCRRPARLPARLPLLDSSRPPPSGAVPRQEFRGEPIDVGDPDPSTTTRQQPSVPMVVERCDREAAPASSPATSRSACTSASTTTASSRTS